MIEPRVLLVRADGGTDRDAELLQQAGVSYLADPYLTIRTSSDALACPRAVEALAGIAVTANWLIVTSRNAVESLSELSSADALRQALVDGQLRGLRVAAVGEVTAEAAVAAGARDVEVPEVSTAAGLAAHLLATHLPGRCVLPRGNIAMKGLAESLRAADWEVTDPIVYETHIVEDRPVSADAAARGEFAAVVLRSPSAARALAHFIPQLPASTVVVCGGPTTAAEAQRVGLTTIVQSPEPTAHSVVSAVVAAVTSGDR